jgi:hypothetical protein
MKDIEKITEKVEKRKTQLQPLFEKDKENYDLWAGKEQIFGDHKMDVNITGTEMTALSHKTQASIVRSNLDIHVLPPGSLPNPDALKTANQEERMYYFGFNEADERLVTIGENKLLPATSWQAIVLGRIAVRILVYQDDDGKIVWDYLPLNPSFLTFSFDQKGLAWACYETFRSPDCIKNEYGVEVTEESQGRGISVSDYWDREHNTTYLTKTKERLGKAWKHSLEEVPIIIQPVAGGPKAINAEGIDVTAWGQSIFDPVKVPFRKLNELRSIWATHARMLAKRPTEEIYEDNTNPNIEEEHLDFHAGALIKHPKSIELKPMEMSEIPASLPVLAGDILTGLQKATYADMSPDKPAHSGSALRILGQDRRDTETPRVDTLDTMCTRICRMTKKQILAQDLTILVKTVVNGKYQVYEMTPEFLDNDFYVDARLVLRDVYSEVEALQTAQMKLQLGLASREDVMEEDLSIQDVPARTFRINWEKIKDEIPEIRLKEMIKVLQEDMQLPEEADMLKRKLAMLELQEQQALVGGMGQGGMPARGTPMGVRPTTGTPARPPTTYPQGVPRAT